MRQQQPSTSSMQRVTEPRLWSFIWSSCTPPRVRTFVWRACHEALPTATNLAKRNPNLSVECNICHVGEESLMHVLLRCSFARQVWALANVPTQLLSCVEESTPSWLLRVYRLAGRET
ncbi:UNVERIFIED_CONTAM: hypothetical protein Sradi_3605700 [Sesamum radiatum]|uniref:Reverse transcriptase zinc-binding domain-containing protein n=1 Tax=Sesamum radiatum TaxID=300843 RepID=A0AAW2QHP4_SESRA